MYTDASQMNMQLLRRENLKTQLFKLPTPETANKPFFLEFLGFTGK